MKQQARTRTRAGSTLIARLTMTHVDGDQTIVEIHTDAGFHDFYRWYRRGKSRRDKLFVRNINRNDAINLQALAERVTAQFERIANQPKAMHAPAWTGRKISSFKIIIFKKRQYVRFLACAADKLPGYKPALVRSLSNTLIPTAERRSGARGLGRYTSLQSKMNILTGKA